MSYFFRMNFLGWILTLGLHLASIQAKAGEMIATARYADQSIVQLPVDRLHRIANDIEIDEILLQDFDRQPAPAQSEGLIVLQHKETKEIWILIEAKKEAYIFPEDIMNTDWIKWPRIRKAADWINSPEPAAWLDTSSIALVMSATFLWAQPWTDPTPKYSIQTVGGMVSALLLLPFALVPKGIICIDRHMNKRPTPNVRRYNIREGMLQTFQSLQTTSV
jgi:hypothetical protein